MRKDRVLYVGDKFGHWTVLNANRVDGKIFCQCDCGKKKMVNFNNLWYGATNSCGCTTKQLKAIKHGLSGAAEYQIWKAMKARCYNKNHKNYSDYGGRGIVVCDKWLHSFQDFLLDMGERPSRNHSIDRINVNDNYSPDNCRWATQTEQTNNTRRNNILTYNGETKTVAEWAAIKGVLSSTIYHRIYAGWSEQMCIETPVRKISTRK